MNDATVIENNPSQQMTISFLDMKSLKQVKIVIQAHAKNPYRRVDKPAPSTIDVTEKTVV